MFPAITACLRPVAQFVVCVAYTLVGTIAVFSRRAGSFFGFQQHGYKHMKAQIHGQQSIIW
eukprot:m.683332 g.683332  ORF g.683332 m.683332 type:complete len:61 (+) comp58604_c0_seq36:1335-1517(+)